MKECTDTNRACHCNCSYPLRRSSFLREFAQACWEFFIDASEAAVGEDDDDVAASQFRHDSLDDGVSIGEKPCWASVLLDLSRESRQFETFVLRNSFGAKDVGDDNFIGLRKAAGKIALQ